jgi:hypothetical protein
MANQICLLIVMEVVYQKCIRIYTGSVDESVLPDLFVKEFRHDCERFLGFG